jgi:hypothetical protein
VKNHPFLDGNKRTGFAAAAVFLETNRRQLTADKVGATAAKPRPMLVTLLGIIRLVRLAQR